MDFVVKVRYMAHVPLVTRLRRHMIYFIEKTFDSFFRGIKEAILFSLESCGLKKTSSKDEFFSHAVEYVTFWICLVGAKGKYRDSLEKHDTYVEMKKTYKDIYTRFQNDMYDYTQILMFKKREKQKYLGVLELVVNEPKPSIHEAWENAFNFVERACKDIEMINDTILKVSKKLPSPYDDVLSNSTVILKGFENTLKDGKMIFFKFKDLIKSLLQSCKDIEHYLPLNSFWKSSKVAFDKQINVILKEMNEECEKPSKKTQTETIMELLSSKCITNFKVKIRRVLDDSIPISELFEIFSQEDITADKLSRELDHIVKLLGNDIFSNKRKANVIRCLDLRLNCEKVVALKRLQTFTSSKLDENCIWQIREFMEIVSDPQKSKKSMLETNSLIMSLESSLINFSEEVVAVINEYTSSENLISFLREILGEDIRNLVDASDAENFYQYLPLVSHLIEVREFLIPILHLPEDSLATLYTEQFEKRLCKTEIKNAAEKIALCREELDSLKNFYNLFANKTEKANDKIKNILQNGKFIFKINENECTMEVLCEDNLKCTASDIIDLRNRALLIQKRFANTFSSTDTTNETENSRQYLKNVDCATRLLEYYQQLKMLGHPLYDAVDSNVEIGHLEREKINLSEICDKWRNNLKEFRQKYSCLKYIKSEQLHLFFKYTKSLSDEKYQLGKKADFDSLLWYIHPDLSLSIIDEKVITENVSFLDKLNLILSCIENNFKKLKVTRKWFPKSITDNTSEMKFSKNMNFICVDKNSNVGPNFILGWFLMKCKRFPLPSQVVICSEDTSWDELYLILLRSREQTNTSDECFCIAFLELLPVEYQRMLIDEVDKFDRKNKLLGLIYRGRSTDSIPMLFKECEIFIQPLNQAQMTSLLHEMFSNIRVYTSDFPGLGKTEEIRRFAASLEKGVKRLLVSGGYQKYKLIRRLKQLDLKPYEILHIEIGLVEKPEEVDIFLFELLTLGYVSTSSQSYVLPKTCIALEITTCPNEIMIDGLPFLMCFSRKHLKWDDYANYKCQLVRNSPGQVVCAYLKKLEENDLNTDIDMSQTSLLNEDKCKILIRKYFPSFKGINFTTVAVFLSVLGNQLKKFSASNYFQNANLSLMIGYDKLSEIRMTILKSLIQFSKEFASRSITSCRDLQFKSFETFSRQSTCQKIAMKNLCVRTKYMFKWENSNHLLVIFHSQDTQTVSAVYKSLEKVPKNIKDLFESQLKTALPDFITMESEKLLEVIVKLTRTKQKQLSRVEISTLTEGYVYTPDNMLKMIMIALRIQSNVPVVVMGETGCGKTSLIRRLARICEARLFIFSVHAGITEKDIMYTVDDANCQATENRAKAFWFFFDELNTSEYVGLISDIVCHRELNGNALSPNLSFIAACNPYRLRFSNSNFTKGLKGKHLEDTLSLLAYRVHPLPEVMLDFVWDYGALDCNEEKAYIQRMVNSKLFEPHENLLVALLKESQKFVREKKSICSVSLRDVSRCIYLIKWFVNEFFSEQHFKRKEMEDIDVLFRSFIMGLTICYLIRFSDSGNRFEYRKTLSEVFMSYNVHSYTEQDIDRYVREEQTFLLNRMDIPKGTARNLALQENVFVMLVCILNKIPLFIVGKPGCSKSLSMQLIRNNMRGENSKDRFLKNHPRLWYSSFQGSESSTSDGIIKVFERAMKFREQNEDVSSLVILDEIGLAERSRFNPLKVLHSLLEPEGKDQPEIAVVGISNWYLDSAKMNRAIHLSRPDMTVEELFITGQSIIESIACQKSLDSILKKIAKAYLEYTDKQSIECFHGLRDYYSYIKYLSRKLDHSGCEAGNSENKKILLKGLLRNFGGQQINNDKMKTTFIREMSLENVPMCKTKKLIKENVIDSEARHLMLIVDGDAALFDIERIIKKMDREFTTLLGSNFSDDKDIEYNYEVLNRIILCMEQPQVLILKDLDDIYGSLYDMLNQNYTIVKGQKHCRVALGPFSNPTCEVNDNFKCIVIIEESNIENTDPPFLNRFEKQRYLLGDFLKPKHKRLVKYLEVFMNDLSLYNKHDIPFGAMDRFPIAGKELFLSLVSHVEQKLKTMHRCPVTESQVLYYCLIELMWILKPDCILRANISYAYEKSRNSVQFLIDMYLDLPIHYGLGHYLKQICPGEETTIFSNEDSCKKREDLLMLVPVELEELRNTYLGEIKNDSIMKDVPEYSEGNERDSCETSENEWNAPFEIKEYLGFSDDHSDAYLKQNAFETDQAEYSRKEIIFQQIKCMRKNDGYGEKLIVFTFSPIHCQIQDALADIDCSFHKLYEYKSEKQFTKDINHFFETSKRKWFVLQCDMKSDYHHIMLAKTNVENSRQRLMKNERTKHVCIVIHITRSTNPFHIFKKINFSTGWTLATLDSIEKPTFSLPYLYNKPALDVLGGDKQEFAELIVRELPWAYAKIQFKSLSNKDDVLKLKNSRTAVEFVSEEIRAWIRRHSDEKDNMDWQHRAACNKYLLETSATVNKAMENILSSLIQNPLARIVFSIENTGLMAVLFSLNKLKPELKDVFNKGCNCQDFYDIDAIPSPSGPGCYLIHLKNHRMKVPFSKLIFEKLENRKDKVLSDVRRANIIPGLIQAADNEELKEAMLAIVRVYSDLTKKDIGLFDTLRLNQILEDLELDFCEFASSTIKCSLSRKHKIELIKWILNRLRGKFENHDVSSFLMTLNIWLWTYFQNIVGIFHLVEFWNTHAKCDDISSNPLYRSGNEKTVSETLETFVEVICKTILSQCVKYKHSEMREWQEKVFKFIAIIGEIGVPSHKLETLKFFYDFVSVVFIPTKCNYSDLNQFALIVSGCEWDLNKLDIFESLWSHLKSLEKSVNVLVLQQVACSFIARCNRISFGKLEQKVVNLKALHYIENGEIFDKRLRFYGQCLRLSLLNYYVPENIEGRESHKFLQMIENGEDNQYLDEYLLAIHQLLGKQDNTSFCALFVLTIEEEIFCNDIGIEQLKNITTDKDVLLRKLFQAKDALMSQSMGIRYCVAVAYMRKFLSITASLICTPSCFDEYVFSAVDRFLCNGTKSKEQKEVQKYFVECLKRNSGELEVLKLSTKFNTTMQFFRTCTFLPIEENIGFSLESLNLARYCKLSDLWLLQSMNNISEDTQFLKRLIEREKTSILSLLCFLHSRLFYVKCVSRATDSDRLFVESLKKTGVYKNVDIIQQLIKHLVNQNDCKRNILIHGVQKSAESTSLTTFLIHVVSLILVYKNESGTLYKAAILNEVPECRPIEIGSSTTFQIHTCTCSHRTISSEKRCAVCSSPKMSEQHVGVLQPSKKEPFSVIVRHILIDAALVTHSLFQEVFSERGLKEIESRERSIQINWRKLRGCLQINDSEQCQILMIFLERVNDLFNDSNFSYSAWNSNYDKKLRYVLQNRYQQLSTDDINHDELCKKIQKTIEKFEDKNTNRDVLFCQTEKPCIPNLYFELSMSEEKFPCLNMILENLEKFRFPQYIEGILKWHRLLITKCSYSLKKVECNSISVGSFINQHNSNIQIELREKFKTFSDNWGDIVTLRPKLEHYTTKLPCVEKITENSKIDLCIIKDKTSPVFQILQALCSLQNKLLDKVLEICVLFEIKALAFLRIGPRKAAIPVVPLMDLQTKHIVTSLEGNAERLELYSQVGCTANLRCYDYDFRKIELEWAYKAFYNRAYILIDKTMVFMEFRDDLYANCVRLLKNVADVIRQTTIDFETETNIKTRLKDDTSQVPELLNLIGTIITVIDRENFKEGQLNMAEFAGKLEKLQQIKLSNKCSFPFNEYDLKLNKVVAFYSLLEEINGEIYFNGLDNELKAAIGGKTKQEILDVVSGKITLLRACESAMHMFLHRYLYVRDNAIKLQQPIVHYLKSDELWKDAQILNKRITLTYMDSEYRLEAVFPQELLVKHVHTFLDLLKKEIEVSYITMIVLIISCFLLVL